MGANTRTVMFLHANGVGPESWDAQLEGLPDGFTGFAPAIPGAGGEAGAPTFTIEEGARGLVDVLDERGLEQVHVCGLSLGAMVAAQLALDAPDRVASLVLSGGQVRPNPVGIKMQRVLVRAMPERFLASKGMDKAAVVANLPAVAAFDLRGRMGEIRVPTLVLVGERDHPNLRGTRELSAGIPEAESAIVPGAGHLWNAEMPETFNKTIRDFYRRQAGSSVAR